MFNKLSLLLLLSSSLTISMTTNAHSTIPPPPLTPIVTTYDAYTVRCYSNGILILNDKAKPGYMFGSNGTILYKSEISGNVVRATGQCVAIKRN